jgi:hypothetical protein
VALALIGIASGFTAALVWRALPDNVKVPSRNWQREAPGRAHQHGIWLAEISAVVRLVIRTRVACVLGDGREAAARESVPDK